MIPWRFIPPGLLVVLVTIRVRILQGASVLAEQSRPLTLSGGSG